MLIKERIFEDENSISETKIILDDSVQHGTLWSFQKNKNDISGNWWNLSKACSLIVLLVLIS